MRLRPAPLLAGLILLTLGVGVTSAADRGGHHEVYALVRVGCLVGGATTARSHRHAGGRTTWRHLANGEWYGAVGWATGVVTLLDGADRSAVGEVAGGALVAGVADGDGLGLVSAGLGFNDSAAKRRAQLVSLAGIADPFGQESRCGAPGAASVRWGRSR